MTVDYNDERFTQVETDKQAALKEVEDTYNGMIKDSDSYYQAQVDASKEWADKQTQLQQEKTDFAIEKIEQQKDQAKKDYTKEQSGAYVDWQKQSDQHGVRAEQIADMGMQNTGYSESSQVSMYNTYQNRVATARESYNNAVLNYNNAIKDARLQNNSVLAEIAYNALQKQLELSLQGFQYKNQLLLGLADKKTQTETLYYQRYQDVLSQINTENALAEQVRQFNEQMALEREQFEWQKARASGSSGGGGYSSGGSRGSSGGSDDISKSSEDIDKDSGGSDNPPLNDKSVMELGFGPLSGEMLAEMEKAGVISSKVKNGQVYFERTAKSAHLGGTKYIGGGTYYSASPTTKTRKPTLTEQVEKAKDIWTTNTKGKYLGGS